jgi:predicted phosphoadenosine phosphosulfate sulfurtransferase
MVDAVVRKAGSKKILLKNNVFDESLGRIRRIFDEFDNIIVGFSGGKDSTVTLNMSLIVAREKGRLPLKVLFLDQEGEWLATIEEVKRVMYNPEIDPIWLQIPFKLFNATSFKTHWLQCWEPGSDWIRPKDPIARTENVYGTDRFGELFAKIIDKEFNGASACYLAGVRAEESPMRYRGLTGGLTYKDITWGKKLDDKKGQYTFYPLYDWTYIDVWKAIHDNDWSYCSIYDAMYQYGVPLNDMRVSNLHHETAVRSLFILQELEPENYARVCARLEGVDMAGKMSFDNFFCPKVLPFMFSGWKEYRDYLLENLITDPEWKKSFAAKFESMVEKYGDGDDIHKKQITSILTNDWEFVKLNGLPLKPDQHAKKKIENAIKKGSKK